MLRLFSRALALASVAALLGACSSLDTSKPGSWIDTIAGGGSEGNGEAKSVPPPPTAGDKPPVPPAATTTAGTAKPAADAKLPTEKAAGQPTEYPNLANQPELQTPGTSESQRREIRDGLIADRDHTQHSADALRGGTEKAAAPPPPAPATKPADGKPTDATTTTDGKPADGSASTPPPSH